MRSHSSLFAVVFALSATTALAQPYAANTTAYKFHAVDQYANLKPDPDHPLDAGTLDHTIDDFPPEPRDIFHQMDQVADAQGHLHPLDFGVEPGKPHDQSAPGQQAVYGRNTWLMWCDGNEDFWDWLAQDGYGVLDFLQLLDSRKRGSRFRDLGLVNQPGMKGTDKPGPYGLYLDGVEKRIGEDDEYNPYGDTASIPRPSDPNALQGDGVNPKVYGYPSGVIGLRLFPNPKFDDTAKRRWNAEAFYNDPVYAKDPKTVRPFLVGMSCAMCHVAAHPLNPPLNPEEPKWSNLSAIIGNQYFRTSTAFGSRVERGNFLWHYLASQQPGTIDTSMVASDQINNGNAMNAVFELPARLARAKLNPPEDQGPAARTMPGIGDSPRLIARVLMDGADSIGVFGALARVYLNIGTYHDEWNLCSNPVIGFVPQRPFSIETCRRNSVYWRVNESFRVNYLQAYFLWDQSAGAGHTAQRSTAAMLLKDAWEPQADGKVVRFVAQKGNEHHWNEDRAAKGSKVFAQNCMVCHSSKQPEAYRIDFAVKAPNGAGWDQEKSADVLTMPMNWDDWDTFKKSPAYTEYVNKALALAGDGDRTRVAAFIADNYFSNDLRIPSSLVGTYSGRALGTNAKEGQVWSDFTSDTYKHLPAVGEIQSYDPFARKSFTFQPEGGGPGYYHVPSLVSIWATAPLLHNNALGKYIPDTEEAKRVSVAGRLEMFDDAIEKLLWKERRGQSPSGEGGLRDAAGAIWRGADPGWVFRTDMETEFRIPAAQLRHLVIGILPGFVPAKLCPAVLALLDHPWILPLCLGLIAVIVAWCCPRWLFYLLILNGLGLLILIPATGLEYLLPWEIWLLPIAMLLGGFLWIDQKGAAADAEAAGTNRPVRRTIMLMLRWSGIVALGVFVVGLFGGLTVAREFVNGHLGELHAGPFPKGTPVNALMNLDPEAGLLDLLAVGRGMAHTIAVLQHDGDKVTDEQRLAVFDEYAGPALMRASKCPDFVLDRGHYFGQALTDEEKRDLIAFLKTI